MPTDGPRTCGYPNFQALRQIAPVHPLVPVAPGVQQPQIGVRLRIVPAPHAAADDGLRVVDVDLVPEPPPNRVIDAMAHNELVRATGGNTSEMAKISTPQGSPVYQGSRGHATEIPNWGVSGVQGKRPMGMKQMSVAPGPYGHPSTPGLTSLLTVSRTGDYVLDTANA